MMPVFEKRVCRIILFCLVLLGVTLSAPGCGLKSNMMTHLSRSILNNNDLAMVEAGAPSYLIMVDSLIDQDPDSADMLCTGAGLYTAYSDVFVADNARKKKLADKATGPMPWTLSAIPGKRPVGLRSSPLSSSVRW